MVIGLILLALPASAQDWALRDGDQLLSPTEMERFSSGTILTYHDDGTSLFSPGGSYSYTYANNGGTAFGRFYLTKDGKVCIDFRNGFSRCDMYVRHDGVLVMLSEKGERFPVRVELGLKQ